MVRRSAGIVKAPADLKSRIRHALDQADRDAEAPWTARMAARLAIFRSALRRAPWVWAPPVGLAAAIALALALAIGLPRRGPSASPPPVPEFDLAIARYRRFQREFIPNVPAEAYGNGDGTLYAWVINRDSVHRVSDEAESDAFDDIARSYRSANMPDDIFQFAQAGYAIAGGRVDRMADGRPVTYTLYTGAAGQILSLCFSDPAMAAPIDAVNWLGMRSFYKYKGYSICLSFYPTGHFISILISQMPVTQMIRDVAAADPYGISR